MPSECSHLPTWKELTFCDPMKGDKDNLSGRRPCGEWVSTTGKSAQWAARAVDARGRWSIGRPAMLACPIAGFAYPMRTQAVSRLAISLAPLVATVGPILTGGEGVAHRVGRAYNDPIQPRGILSQWHRLPTPRDCAGRPISEAQKKEGRGPGWPAPSATNQPSRRAAVHSGQPPTNMKPHAITTAAKSKNGKAGKADKATTAQSFPSDYKFTGTITQIHKQIGNAVPPALARQLFRAALSN